MNNFDLTLTKLERAAKILYILSTFFCSLVLFGLSVPVIVLLVRGLIHLM